MSLEAMESKKTAITKLTQGLNDKGVGITTDQLEKFVSVFRSKEALGVSYSESLNLGITDGSGSWTGTYPTFDATVTGNAKVMGPDNGDTWYIKVYDRHESETIWSGNAVYGQSANFAYSTGFDVKPLITAKNISNPQFNGTLTLKVSVSV